MKRQRPFAMAKAFEKKSRSSSEESDSEDEDQQITPRSGSNKKSKSSRMPLSETQKSTNHKDAENKRRNAIREQFTELSRLIPGAEGHERSEYLMLQMTIAFMKEQSIEARKLEQEIVSHGGNVMMEEKMRDDEWGGPDFTPRNAMEYDAAKARRSAGGSRGKGSKRSSNGFDDEE